MACGRYLRWVMFFSPWKPGRGSLVFWIVQLLKAYEQIYIFNSVYLVSEAWCVGECRCAGFRSSVLRICFHQLEIGMVVLILRGEGEEEMQVQIKVLVWAPLAIWSQFSGTPNPILSSSGLHVLEYNCTDCFYTC